MGVFYMHVDVETQDFASLPKYVKTSPLQLQIITLHSHQKTAQGSY